MTDSAYMPSVSVEVAWSSGFATPAVDRVWTDVSEWVELAEGMTVSFGRGDERSTADANQLGLTLDNSDGRFTVNNSLSPYFPNVRLDRPVRVSLRTVEGIRSVRFVGYVNEWPVSWDGTDAYASSALSASSRLARLGLTTSLRSLVEMTLLADGPLAYYPLGEPVDSTQANDASGLGAAPLVLLDRGDPAPVVFGTATGPGTDSLTAAQFAGGQYLGRDGTSVPHAGVSFECFFACPEPLPVPARLALAYDTAAPAWLELDSTGKATAHVPGAFVTGALDLCDGATHHVALTWDGTTLLLYVDGVGDGTVAAAGAPGLGGLAVGLQIEAPVTPSPLVAVAHVAVYDTVLPGPRILAHAAAGLTGFAGETTGARLERYALLGGIPADEISVRLGNDEVDAPTGTTTMSHVDTTDKQVVELMRVVEETEGGVLFDDRDGTLVLHNRTRRYIGTTAAILDMRRHEVEADYNPRYDRTGLLNDVSAANQDGTVTARQKDDQAILDNGVATASVTTASEDPGEPLQKAAWLVHTYAEPKARVPTLTVDVLAQVDKNLSSADVLALGVGDLVRVLNHPPQWGNLDERFFIEGGTETYGPESLRVTFNLSPASPSIDVLIVGDPLRGVVGTAVVAY